MSNNEMLVVESLYLYPKENAVRHHTHCYELVQQDSPTVVLRRGQTFHLSIRFKGRTYEDNKDIVRLIFTFGPNPLPLKGTKGVASMTNDDAFQETLEAWEVRLQGKDESSITIECRSPADSPVGEWQFQVETKLKGDDTTEPKVYQYSSSIYLLFNPWAKDDQVHMDSERLLDEYVLNDVGKIWVGPWGSARGREWVFGQFDGCVLPAVMKMLERAFVAPPNRGDPITVTRAISRIVNSIDEDTHIAGVITGRWDGDYDDGTAPAAWTGSVAILEEYLKTGLEVKYGQCWVFAGVVTTVCRALGIPSRVVSNLVSAHDANASLTVDRYFDERNEAMDYDPNNEDGEDSIWNYHVWNDVWMRRPDLPKGYGGWQAIDATPQETSNGLYQCGPASLEAIKCGAVGFSYDVPFLLASVNADLVRWKEDPTCDLGFSKIDCNKYHIGRAIFTKAPWIYDPNGDKDRQDITEEYKAKEGTKAERLTLMNGVRSTERAKRFYMLPTKINEDIDFELVLLDRVNIGDDFSITVSISNKSETVRNVQAVLSAGSVYYTGIKANIVKKASGDFKVQPKSKEQLRLVVKSADYLGKLVEYCNMKIYAIATVTDTRETWAAEDDFQVIKPSLNIKVPDEVIVMKRTPVTFSFKNPLNKSLTNCKVMYEGPRLTRKRTVSYKTVGPLEDVLVESEFMPLKEGNHKLIGTFSSKELIDITGSILVEAFQDGE